MSFIKSVFVISALFVTLSTVEAQQAARVQATVKLERPKGMDSPTVNPGGREMSFKPKQWMLLEAKMNVQAAPAPKTGYLDSIIVRFYVAAKNPESKGQEYVLLKKEIKYVNVPLGSEVYACVFLSPSSIKRLTGSETITGNMFNNYGVEIVYGGKPVAADSHRQKVGWWNISSPSLVPSGSFPLLDKNETPFSIFWYDRYPEIAPKREAKDEPSSGAVGA